MNTQTDMMLVEEFTEQELEAISGGQSDESFDLRFRGGLINAAVILNDVNINVVIGDSDFDDD